MWASIRARCASKLSMAAEMSSFVSFAILRFQSNVSV